jgi:Holliday junction resolvase RusA-like endonuclease
MRPKSHSKARMSRSEPKLSRPDIDNLAKLGLDALNGIAYIDDGQVYWLNVHKFYVGNDQQAGTEIEIREAGATQ